MLSGPAQFAVSLALTVLLISTALPSEQVSARSVSYELNIPSEPLDSALQAVALASHHKLFYRAELVAGKASKELKGTYTAEEAVTKLLEGTSLSFEITPASVVLIKGPESASRESSPAADSPRSDSQTTSDETSKSSKEEGRDKKSQDFRVAQVDQASTGPQVASDQTPKKDESLTEIVVTGTHIRGAPSSSPLITIGTDEIEKSGYTEVGDFIRSLPQNFAGGISPQNAVGASATEFSNTNASAPNLRGLGSGSTLTLVNGHRLGQDSEQGAVDISLIPLDAIERVEVMTDGASATYGSDAVAGVVNFVLKKDYNGAQSTVSVGKATEGGGFDRRFSQLLGTTWDGGGVVGNYEHEGQDAVFSTDRSFSSAANTPWTLLPSTRRNSLFISGHQDILSNLNFFIDGLYTDRDSDSVMTPAPQFTEESSGPVKQYEVAPGLDLLLGNNWRVEGIVNVAGEAARSDLNEYQSPTSPRTLLEQLFIQTRTRSFELTGDGPIYQSPAGPDLIAVGVGYRQEDYSQDIPLVNNSVSAKRNIRYAYGELSIPLVAPSDSVGLNLLEFHVSGRTERYSDVGTSSVPKLGLNYKPLRDITLHASWSKSFRAPTLFETHSPTYAELYPVANPASPGGTSPILLNVGGNPNLAPETSTSWTFGADYAPASTPDLRFSADYFHIDYKNRISALGNPVQTLLLDPINDPFLTRSPGVSQQNAIIAAATGGFFNLTGAPYNPASVAAIADLRYLNFESQSIQGVDWLANYTIKGEATRTNIFLNATYLQLRQQISPTAPAIELAGTVFNPPRVRARAGSSYGIGPLTATGTINYLGKSANTDLSDNPTISAWWTFDTQVVYALKTTSRVFDGLRVSLSVQNLFDKNPPYVADPGAYAGFNYDSLNATPLGRYVTLQLSGKFW